MSGLERKRNCGFVGEPTNGRVVWVGGGVAAERCPKSIISAASLSWLEEFHTWRRVPAQALFDWDARTVEAMLLLDEQSRKGVDQ